MNDVSKQQLILLALLVSFVTSLATGIITVSLMDKTPDGVPATVSQVIEKTIQQIVPQDAAVTTAQDGMHDQVAAAVQKVSNSVLKITDSSGTIIGGLGLAVSSDGVVMTDKSVINGINSLVAVLPSGESFPVYSARAQNNGDIVFLAPVNPKSPVLHHLVPVVFGNDPQLGLSLLSLSGTSTYMLGQGIVTQAVSTSSGSLLSMIETSIPLSKVAPGGPVFNLDGRVVGIKTTSSGDDTDANFYPVSAIMDAIPKLK